MKKVSLGKGHSQNNRDSVAAPQIEKGAMVGYKPGRTITDNTLKIGKAAHIRSGTVIYAGSTIGVNGPYTTS